MNLLRTLTALLPLAFAVPASYAQTHETNLAPTTHVEHLTSSDDLIAVPSTLQALPRAPWATTAPAVSDLTVAPPQARFVFADEVPLQAGMFDSATAWEDEP